MKKGTRKAIALVEEVPPRCPRCGSTKRTHGDKFQTRRIVGETRDGKPYNLLKWFYSRCADCSQRYKVIRREYKP